MQENLIEIEKSLWEAADQLRANSKLTATEYSMPVLGLIFLRFAFNRFLLVKEKIESNLPFHPERGRREIHKQDFLSEKAIFLPEKSRFDYLIGSPDGQNLGEAINEAMRAIEEEYPTLQGVLPKNYNEFEDDLLSDLLRIFDRDAIRHIEGDAFGKIYEYFLNEFAVTGAQEGGEFFTPSSLVNTIVNVIQPDHGIILDPACGSAGMFVQTGHFIEEEGFNPSEKITIYGQEKTTTNTRIAKMNLAVHGLEGHIAETNTFYNDEFDLAGKCDFVMANPPFNVDGVDKSRNFVKNDPRLLFTVDEGGNKVRLLPKNDNANYLWIQYFYGYLNETGRAGFVMASSASDAGNSEKEIREKLIKTGAVDIIISVGTNFFYTRSLPCTLWFFDRSNENDLEKRNKTLMLDARNIFRVVNRKINDFSPEQLKNIKTIVDLYRGDSLSFIKLIDQYTNATVKSLYNIDLFTEKLINALELLYLQTKEFVKEKEEFRQELVQTDKALQAFKKEHNILKEIKSDLTKDFNTNYEINEAAEINKLQHIYANRLFEGINKSTFLRETGNQSTKELLSLINLVMGKIKLNKNTVTELWKNSEIRKRQNEIELIKKTFIEAVMQTGYYYKQINWMQSHFPEAKYLDVEGLCKVVTIENMSENDYSLTPGRYVGITPRNEENYNVIEKLKSIKNEIELLNKEACELSKIISSNFEALGI